MPRRKTAGASLIALLLMSVLAGCGGTASPAVAPSPTLQPTPSPTPPPTPTPTPSPTPAPTPAPSSTPKIDPTASLKIGAPYTLAPLDPVQSAAFEAGIQQGLGGLAQVMRIGVRQVMSGSSAAGLVLVMEFPGIPLSGQPGFLDNVVAPMAGTDGKVTRITILGTAVRLVSRSGQYWVVYQRGEGVVAVYGTTAKAAQAIAAALIKAGGAG